MAPSDQIGKVMARAASRRAPGPGRWRRTGLGARRWADILAVVPMALMSAVSTAGPAWASVPAAAPGAAYPILYAYSGGQATAPATCPRTNSVASRCTLAQALGRAGRAAR